MRGTALVALALLAARTSMAQAAGGRPVTLAVRLDGIVASRHTTTHVGLGLTKAASRNLEMEVVAAGGVTVRESPDDARLSARADVLARFAPRPAGRGRWIAYAAGGVSALVERGARGRGVIAVLVGARGRRAFVEAGLGGGVRVGAGLRF